MFWTSWPLQNVTNKSTFWALGFHKALESPTTLLTAHLREALEKTPTDLTFSLRETMEKAMFWTLGSCKT